MKKIIKLLFVVIFVLLISPIVVLAQPTMSDFSKKVILLNNDRIVHGEIFDDGNVLQVRNELGLITIFRSDIVMIGATLREVWQFKKENTPHTSDDCLQLADWCVTNQLVEEAVAEFDRAILLAGHPQQADAIRNRKNATLTMFAERHSQVDMVEQENQKYRQWKEIIPAATFATFQREILPILVQNCNGIACHSGNSLNDFRFVANPNNNDVDVAKNLQVVLGYVTPGAPDESPLVLVPIAPHGRTKQIFTRQQNLAKYQKLYFWTKQVAKEMDTYFPLDESDRKRQSSMIQPGTENHGQIMTIQPASGENIPFPMPGETLVDNIQPNAPSLQNQPSSLAQGLTQNTGASNHSQQQRATFNFFEQHSIVVPGTSPGGWQGPAPDHPGLKKNRETTVMTHTSTESFEQNNLLQQMQRPQVDPFDPVLFNRQYHFQRIQEKQP